MSDSPPGLRAFAVVCADGSRPDHCGRPFNDESDAWAFAEQLDHNSVAACWPHRVVPLTAPPDAEAVATVKALYQAAREALTNGDSEWHEDEKHDDWRICHEVVSLLDEALNDSALARALAALGIEQEER